MAVLFDGSTNALSRSTNLPASNAYTFCGWAQVNTDLGTTYQALAELEGSAGTYSGIFWEGGTSNAMCVERNSLSGANFASRPATGAPFFWAIAAGSNLNGYWRSASQNAFTTASVGSNSFTVTSLHVANTPASEWLNGRVWNVKCWGRELSAAELMVESFYRRVMFPASINFHWPLDNANDTNDYSGNGRNPTVGGTLTTADGSHGLVKPMQRQPIFTGPQPRPNYPGFIRSNGGIALRGNGSLLRA
jgi:hypothetical protein